MTEAPATLHDDTRALYDNTAWPVTPAGVVVSQHARLHDLMAHPTVAIGSYVRNFAGDTLRKLDDDTDMASGMWYPFRVWDSVESARYWCGDVAKSLFQARTFQVTAEMSDVVTALYEKSTGLFHLEEPELPAPHGFLWLDKPRMVIDKRGKWLSERVFTWSLESLQSRVRIPDEGGDYWHRETIPGIRLTSWNFRGDPDEFWSESPDEDKAMFDLLGDLILSHTMIVPFGERHSHLSGKVPHPEDMPGDYKPDSGLAWLHHLWMFMDTEVTALKRETPDRRNLKRARRSLQQGEVNVVTLRRSHSVENEDWDGDPRDIDWSCRWIVQGHDRHLENYSAMGFRKHHALRGGQVNEDGDPVCATCRTRITWVHAYVKGPDGLPLKSSKQLYRVSR